MAEFSPATREARVRFPASAIFLNFVRFCLSMQRKLGKYFCLVSMSAKIFSALASRCVFFISVYSGESLRSDTVSQWYCAWNRTPKAKRFLPTNKQNKILRKFV